MFVYNFKEKSSFLSLSPSHTLLQCIHTVSDCETYPPIRDQLPNVYPSARVPVSAGTDAYLLCPTSLFGTSQRLELESARLLGSQAPQIRARLKPLGWVSGFS